MDVGITLFLIELSNLSCHYIGRGRAEINAETHIMRSTVVKMDTASRKRRGSSSRAEINAEAILCSSTVENKDKMEPIMSHSTVVKKDTVVNDMIATEPRSTWK